MPDEKACPDCLRRAWLLSTLGPYLEQVTSGSARSSLPELLRLSNHDLVTAVAPAVGEQILARVSALDEGWFADSLDRASSWAVCRHRGGYPAGLLDGPEPACALFGRGDPGLLGAIDPWATVTIVGSRRATSYGRQMARDLARELASSGIVVTSGLAFGIDACAHRGAIAVAGRTIAVLGCGPDTSYPAAHRALWRTITESGAVISELPPGSAPWRWSFPARNRVMAALAGMTVVVEAAARSGSLVTADIAAELGRDLGAVPGPVTSRASAGPNELLAAGACVVRDGRDVFDALLGTGSMSPIGGGR